MPQLVTRLDERLVADVDRLVEAGVVASRSDAVRRGLVELIERERRSAVGAAITEGYRRRPQTDDEVGWADAATAQMIAEEAW